MSHLSRPALTLLAVAVLAACSSTPQQQALAPPLPEAPPIHAADAPTTKVKVQGAGSAVLTARRMDNYTPPAPPAPSPAKPQMGAYYAAPASIVPLPVNTERYAHQDDNPVQRTAEQPVSIFSIDVDTGSYSNMRRMVEQGQRPPADAVRAEEFINYFDYHHAAPVTRETPFRVTTELAPAPWNAQRQLLMIGIKGYELPKQELPPSNLVFLLDTSGSMNQPDKLPLLKQSLAMLVPQLRA